MKFWNFRPTAVQMQSSVLLTQHVLVVCWCFWTACQPNLQGLGSYFWSVCLLKMGPLGYPRALVDNYQHTLHNNSEEENPQVVGNC
jgi:hypothetical protein